jgi:AmmeMemoRadiSam system protein A
MKELLTLARECLKNQFTGEKLDVPDTIKKKYSSKKACFVTLTQDNELRGCIGSLEARQELWQDIIENTLNAAFKDPRFLPLSYYELDKIKIEISILTTTKRLNFKNEKELLSKINKKMGLILKKSFYSSTFLPQVWEEIPDKTEFLEHLSIKAGLNKDDWKDAEIGYYEVEKVKEE